MHSHAERGNDQPAAATSRADISPSKPLYPDAKVDILRLGPTDAKGVFV